jgi:hypothetical protein
MGTPDLTLQECCQRWGVSSRNSVKARAAALGVELRRESSTRTVWPRDDVPLGDELHDHLQTGGTLRDFPGALPQSQQQARPLATTSPAVPAVTASSDALALAMLQLLQQQAPQQPGALARARGMAAAADERLPLTTAELAQLVGLDADEVEGLKAGSTLYGFRLRRVGSAPRKGSPDRRAWLLERLEADAEPVSAGSPLPPVMAPEAPSRAPGFLASLAPVIEAQATVLSRLELPRW